MNDIDRLLPHETSYLAQIEFSRHFANLTCYVTRSEVLDVLHNDSLRAAAIVLETVFTVRMAPLHIAWEMVPKIRRFQKSWSCHLVHCSPRLKFAGLIVVIIEVFIEITWLTHGQLLNSLSLVFIDRLGHVVANSSVHSFLFVFAPIDDRASRWHWSLCLPEIS